MTLWQRLLAGITVLAAAAVLAPAAMASITPSLTLDQSPGTSAGGTHNLNLTLNTPVTGTDSPKDLTFTLPPGLLANAAVDNGTCLKTAASTSPVAACQAGTGVVTASPNIALLGLPLGLPLNVPVTFYLVKPPNSRDLAGLEVYSSTLGQLGSTGDVYIRASNDPAGVGATIKLVLPNSLPGLGAGFVSLSITKITSTLENLRYPATCQGLSFGASVDSYSDPTVHNLSQPLSVSGCSSLKYNPKFAVTAARDKTDKVVTLGTTIAQAATEAPSKSVSLTFPTSFLGANINSLGTLCPNSTGSGCSAVGSVTAASPLYPSALSGNAYLTGDSSGLSLTLVFPAPFPLTLVGRVNLATNTAAFTGLPDIPLTSLAVNLNGGPKGLFATNCVNPTGSATATLVDQQGDQTRSVPASFTVSGCPANTTGTTGTTPTTGTTGTTGTKSGGSSGTSTGSATVAGTHLVAKMFKGLATGKPSLTFTVSTNKKQPKLKRVTVTLPKGLSFVKHKVHKKRRVIGVSLKGSGAKSVTLSKGKLVITLRSATRKVTVKLGPKSLKESAAMLARARQKKLKSLALKVAVRNAKGKTHSLKVTVTKLHLS